MIKMVSLEKIIKIKFLYSYAVEQKKTFTLLKSSPKLKSPRTSLSDEEFVKLLDSMSIADENFFELQKYSAMMISYLHWEN